MFHKYEYVENASAIAWHHEFENSFEYKNGFSIDLASRFKFAVAGDVEASLGYNLKLKKGHIYLNISESEGFKNIDQTFSQYARLTHNGDLRLMINDLFGIRKKYPSFSILREYYINADLRDIEMFLHHFENVFEAVVEKCGSEYRNSVMQGATELAFALSHKGHSAC